MTMSRITGRTVSGVRSVGKHILMEFSGGLLLRTHMRMNGSWHVYRPGESWQRPRRSMRIVVATEDFVAVGFDIPVAEMLKVKDLRRHDELRRLGPDLLADDFDGGEAIRRIRERTGSEIADVLLNQRVLAGIGNVYKSEILFACGVSPFARVEVVDRRTDRLPRVHGATVPHRERHGQSGRDDHLHRFSTNDAAVQSEGAALGLRSRRGPVPQVRDAIEHARTGT